LPPGDCFGGSAAGFAPGRRLWWRWRPAQAADDGLSRWERASAAVASHSVLVASMGDYLEAAARRAADRQTAPLRDPFADDEELARRQSAAFGNPFRAMDGSRRQIDRQFAGIAVDEAGEAPVME
jgi:hypothetical protein